MTPKALEQKQHIIDMANALEDEEAIDMTEQYLATILGGPMSLPSGEALLIGAQAGEADIEAGRFGTLDDLREAWRKGVDEGLRRRHANGYNA